MSWCTVALLAWGDAHPPEGGGRSHSCSSVSSGKLYQAAPYPFLLLKGGQVESEIEWGDRGLSLSASFWYSMMQHSTLMSSIFCMKNLISYGYCLFHFCISCYAHCLPVSSLFVHVMLPSHCVTFMLPSHCVTFMSHQCSFCGLQAMLCVWHGAGGWQFW